MTSYIAALVWSIGGFLAGFYAGRVTHEVHIIKEAVVDGEDTAPEPAEKKDPWWSYRPNLGVLIIAMSILTVVTIAFVNIQRGQRQDCQAEVNARLIAAINGRAQIGDRSFRAVNDLIVGAFSIPPDLPDKERRALGQKLFADYQAALAEGDAIRKANPLPTEADFACGQ